MNIIPGFNCLDEESLGEWLAKAGAFLPPGTWIHLDVSDGIFTFTKTWNDPASWQKLAGQYGFNLEVHLMVEHPENVVRAWLEAGAKRVIVHIEAVTVETLRGITELCEQYKVDASLSSNPETPIESFRPYIHAVAYFQVLAVNPGLSGQRFLTTMLEKVKLLRSLRPYAKIEVDGGMNPETAALCRDAGADFVVATSYIFWGSDPKAAWEELNAI